MDPLLSALLVAAALTAVIGVALRAPALRRLSHWWAPAFRRARARAAQYQARVAESQQRFQDFAEASSDWFWEMGPDLRFTYMSERIRDVLGFDFAYPIGKRREDLSDLTLEPEHWARHLDDLRQHRAVRDFTYKLRLPDEQLRYISVSGKPIFGTDGRFLGYRGTGRDVTATVVSQQALEKQTQFVLTLFENLPFGLIHFDASMRCVAFNERVLELHDFPRGHFKLGDPLEKFVRFNASRGEYAPIGLDELMRDRMNVATMMEARQFERRRPDGRVI